MKACSLTVLKPSFAAMSLALLAACSQTPAQVVMKGSEYYGNGRAPEGIQMASASIRAVPESKPNMQEYQPAETVVASAAPVAEISVSEMPPVELSTVQVRSLDAPVISQPEMMASMPMAQESLTPPVAVSKPEMMPATQAKPIEKQVSSQVASGQFIWPVEGGKLLAGFGPKAGGAYNDGLNIAAREGNPVFAAADGKVIYAGNELRGYGNMVIVKHSGGFVTAYAHTSRMLVRKGDMVKQGEQIALVGRSGGVDQPQLHFSLRQNKEPVDPMAYLPGSHFAAR